MKTFHITLRAARDADDATAIRALRAVLKIAWRSFQLRALDCVELSSRDDKLTKRDGGQQ